MQGKIELKCETFLKGMVDVDKNRFLGYVYIGGFTQRAVLATCDLTKRKKGRSEYQAKYWDWRRIAQVKYLARIRAVVFISYHFLNSKAV